MLSLGLAGLDFKTGAHEGPGHDHWGGDAPCYFATHGPSGSPLGSHGTRGGHSPFYRHPTYIHLHLALGPFEGNP